MAAAYRPPGSIRPDEPMATALDPAPTPPELTGPQPVDAYIRRALAENRAVQAARFNVLAMKGRIPQVTALDDPMVQNTIWPFPSNAPQYSHGLHALRADDHPGVPLVRDPRLRGQAAEQEVQIALFELAARPARRRRPGQARLLRPVLQRSGPRRSWARTGSWRTTSSRSPGSATRPAARASRTCSGPRWR